MTACVLVLVLFTGFWFGQKQELLQASSVKLQETVVTKPAVLAAKSVSTVTAKEITSVKETDLKKETVVLVELAPLKVPQQKAEIQLVALQPDILQPDILEQTKEASAQSSAQIADIEHKNDYQVEAADGVSDDLLARFQAAIDDTKDSTDAELSQTVEGNIKSLTQMPVWVQEGVPSMRFDQHIYASDGAGWVKVNGRDRYEGDSIANGVIIDKILPQQVILTYRGEKFSLPALTNW